MPCVCVCLCVYVVRKGLFDSVRRQPFRLVLSVLIACWSWSALHLHLLTYRCACLCECVCVCVCVFTCTPAVCGQREQGCERRDHVLIPGQKRRWRRRRHNNRETRAVSRPVSISVGSYLVYMISVWRDCLMERTDLTQLWLNCVCLLMMDFMHRGFSFLYMKKKAWHWPSDRLPLVGRVFSCMKTGPATLTCPLCIFNFISCFYSSFLFFFY